MKISNEPLCDACNCWRDYRYDLELHPDYDGHCWFRGIMTLNVQECPEFDGENQPRVKFDPKAFEVFERKPKSTDGQYVPNQWDAWKRKQALKNLFTEQEKTK